MTSPFPTGAVFGRTESGTRRPGRISARTAAGGLNTAPTWRSTGGGTQVRTNAVRPLDLQPTFTLVAYVGESPYSCSECSQSFISATYLTRHKKRHSKPGLKDLTSETLMTHAENSKVEPVHREKVRASGQDLSRTVVFVRLGEGGDPQ